MSVKFRLEGGGEGAIASVLADHERHQPGLMAFTHPADHYNYSVQPLTNSTYGASLAVDPTAISPTLVGVHDGTDTILWTASNIIGGGFVFNSPSLPYTGTFGIDATGTNNNDTADFNAGATLAISDFTAFRAYINISSFPTTGTKDVTVQLYNGGAPIGVELSIKPYVNTTSTGVWQLINIPFTDFNLGTATQLDALRIKSVDSGPGSAPDYYLDDIALVASAGTAGTAEYRYQPDNQTTSSVLRLRFSAYHPTNAVADPTKLFGLSPANGLSLAVRDKKRVYISLVFRDVWDALLLPNSSYSVTSDGGTGGTHILDFDIPLEHLLVSGPDGTFLELSVRDDLTGWSRATCSVHVANVI